ncbi:MAG: YjbH domain-containing protein [Bacteroidales bacterium]
MPSKPLLLLCAILLPLLSLIAQTVPTHTADDISGEIVKKGYENVRVTRRHDTLMIGFENRVWRWEVRGVAELLKTVMPLTDSGTVVSLTLLRTGIPVTTVTVSRKQYDHLLTGKLTPAAFSDSVNALLSDHGYKSALRLIKPANSSFNNFDVVVIPQLKFQFGNFTHPLELQFNIAPAVQISFTRGMTATLQVIFPVYNNIIGDPEGNTIRPGLMVLSQAFRLPYNIFTTVSAGYFTRNRYGVNGEARKYFFNGKLAVSAEIGYTGQLQLIEGQFNYSEMDVVTWFCDAAYRFAPYDLTLRAGYGRFLNGDMGWRVDVGRQFGEVSIGFFAMRSDGMVNGGFNFTVPIPPRRYGTKNRIRLRPASYIPWEYRAKGLPDYGRSFTTGSGTDELMFNMNPDDIRKQLGKHLKNY